jgi:hypothetical protein
MNELRESNKAALALGKEIRRCLCQSQTTSIPAAYILMGMFSNAFREIWSQIIQRCHYCWLCRKPKGHLTIYLKSITNQMSRYATKPFGPSSHTV